jgi:hypothetical protein
VYNNIAQKYLEARRELVTRLAEIETELQQIKSALGLSGDSHKPAARAARPATRGAVGRRGKRGSGLLAILRTLNDKGPIKPVMVAQLSGVRPTTVSNALSTLKNKRLTARSDRGWTLTPAGKAELAKREKQLA